MPPIRFRIRTIMIVIAAVAVLMGMPRDMPRWSDSLVLPLKAIVVLTVVVLFFHRNRTDREAGSGSKGGVQESEV
jgi:hypothetical protein